ncbi:MAG: hypothetical protein SCARUB_02485 [Candidatus Scalindua rubra]|uniref:DUF4926 domain-containing protein n=1 Tax=Candidatus Scalindua rubra TaxID=1872076 RepID=A0A1E3XBN9_9BACT|nr:MAG: hypothetical protein SCARUB_02485 [Candidatus Scalindua rubra]
MIKEHDRIVLSKDLQAEGLLAGDVGTVVHIYNKGEAYEVEFMTLEGETVTVVTLPSSSTSCRQKGYSPCQKTCHLLIVEEFLKLDTSIEYPVS